MLVDCIYCFVHFNFTFILIGRGMSLGFLVHFFRLFYRFVFIIVTRILHWWTRVRHALETFTLEFTIEIWQPTLAGIKTYSRVYCAKSVWTSGRIKVWSIYETLKRVGTIALIMCDDNIFVASQMTDSSDFKILSNYARSWEQATSTGSRTGFVKASRISLLKTIKIHRCCSLCYPQIP